MRTEPVPQTDDLPYRDYLVSIVDEFVTKPPTVGVEFPRPGTPHTPAEIRQKSLADLRARFKQDFATEDNAPIAVNKIAIGVLKTALVEDLGFAANTIPDQGRRGDREYLDDLIARSQHSIDDLVATYHVSLDRLDSEQTTRVRQNILTLQAHLRDDRISIESSGDTSSRYNPFFLYKDEWRLRFGTLFFAENHYALKQGLFATSADRAAAAALMAAVAKQQEYAQPTQAQFTESQRAHDFMDRLTILLQADQRLVEGHDQYRAEEYTLALDSYARAADLIRAAIAKMVIHVAVIPDDGSTMEIRNRAPSLGDAEAFRGSLDPRNTMQDHVFGDVSNIPFGWPEWPTVWDQHKNDWWDPVDVPKKKIPAHFPFTGTLIDRLAARYDHRAAMKVGSPDELRALEMCNVVSVRMPGGGPVTDAVLAALPYIQLERMLLDLHDDLVSLVPHVMFLLLPICRGDAAAGLGDFASAANGFAEVGRELLMRASLWTTTPAMETPSEAAGDLPWTWTIPATKPLPVLAGVAAKALVAYAGLNGRDYPYLNLACEVPLVQLRLGALYLSWADLLYRHDQEPEVFRARELYKAVLRQYGVDPLPGAVIEPLPMVAGAWAADGVYERPLLKARAVTREVLEPTALHLATPVDRDGHNGGAAELRQLTAARLERDVKSLPASAKATWQPLIAAGLSPQMVAEPDSIFAAPVIAGGFVKVLTTPVNPAILAQQMRAKIGITQIDAGLNFYGYGDNLVPLLRYRPLAVSATHFADLAKQAETDFMSFKEHAEAADLALIQARSAVVAAAVRVEIESQRELVAADRVQQSQIQVQQVKDAITDKQNEISDHNSFCGQIKDLAGGIASFLGGVPEFAGSYIKTDFKDAFGLEKAAAGGTAGLGVVGGIALFGTAAAVTMDGMATQANKRQTDLDRLRGEQLPLALAGLDASRHELAIAQLQKSVATLESQTAQEVLRYSLLRTLSADAWAQMSSAMKSVLRRYLDLGAMTGWLAERALSYAQDRDLRLIRFDYFRPQAGGLLAADQLQSDLASLEKEYLAGYHQTVPIKWTISLARDFPLQFGQLKAHGRCAFMTEAADLDRAFPGCFAHRLRTLEVAAIVPTVQAAPHGMLSNPGLSVVQGEALDEWHDVVRPPDVLPLSEFRLRDDMAVYEMPSEALLPFEGSGIDTLWMLELPPDANPAGLATLADVCITFDRKSSEVL